MEDLRNASCHTLRHSFAIPGKTIRIMKGGINIIYV